MSSTSGYLGKKTNRLEDYVRQLVQEGIDGQWGPIDGEVVSYDSTKGTGTIKPLYKPVHDGKPVQIADLLEVPIEFPRTGNSAITSPVPAGTRVRLTPMMRSAENYDTEDDGEPSDARAFHLADVRATITGGESLTEPLANVDPENTHVRFNADGTYGLRGSPDGKIMIEGNQGNIYELINDAVEQTKEGFGWLKLEPALIYTGQYAAIEAQLETILGKLRAMQL